MDRKEAWLRRIDDVEPRLAERARPLAGLTSPDPATSERWEAGQAWGHLSEFVDFWIPHFKKVIEGFDGEPVAFGREPGDTRRPDSIEAGRTTPPEESWSRLRADLARLREFVRSLDEPALAAVGHHHSYGTMSMDQMVERFLIGHLEEHAEQLEHLD
jgi:hypothetical protein